MLPFKLLLNQDVNYTNFDEKIKRLEIIRLGNNQYENVIRFPDQNTLNTKVKQIRNPQKEISGGFFMVIIRNARKKNKI